MALSKERLPHVCSSFASSALGYRIIKDEPVAPSAQRGAPVRGEPWPGWDTAGEGAFSADTPGQCWQICCGSPGELVMRDEFAKSTAKGLIKVSNFPLFPFLTAA